MWDVHMVFPHTSPKCESYPKVSRGKTQTWTTCVSLGMRWRIDASNGTSHSLWCLGSTCLGQYVWHTWSQAHILVGTHVWVAAHQFKTRKEKVSSSLWKHWANRMMSFASSHLRSFWNPAPSPTGLLVRVEGRRWIFLLCGFQDLSLLPDSPLFLNPRRSEWKMHCGAEREALELPGKAAVPISTPACEQQEIHWKMMGHSMSRSCHLFSKLDIMGGSTDQELSVG